MNTNMEFVKAIASSEVDAKAINDSLLKSIQEKVKTILDIKRVEITANIYNKAVAK